MIEHFLDQLNNDRLTISKQWAYQVSQISSSYQKIDIADLEHSAYDAFGSFLEIIRNNDFKPVDRYIAWLTTTRTGQGISFTELQEAFSTLRYIMFDILADKMDQKEFQKLMARINRAIDWIVFRFSQYFKEVHELKLRDYANSLEDKVKQRTLELEESKKSYQVLFEEISDGCFVWQNGNIVIANKGFCEMHDCSPEAILGKSYYDLVAEDFVDMIKDRFSSVMKGSPASDCFIFFRKGKDRKRFPTETRSKLINYEGHSAVLVLCTDITERLNIEERLRQQDRFAIIGSLTTSIAHEIRNPLSAIKINTQILLDRLSLSGNDKRRLEISYEQLSHLEKTISQILDYSKPINLNYTIGDIHKIVGYALELLQKKLDENHIRVLKTFDLSLPNVMLDKERIMASFLNIMNNAVDAMAETQRKKQILVQTYRSSSNGKDYICLSIDDSGIGVEPHDRETIFEPFFTKGKADGIGLGLSIVKKILEAHRGKIQATGGIYGGASFRFMIPINAL
jgi:PAS domain S-box-containing protein